MSTLTLRERRALRYASIKHAGDREVRAEHRVRSAPRRASRLLSRLQRWFERSGWFLVLLIGMGFFGLAACGRFEPRPDLKVSTLTQSSVVCVHGHRTEQVGTMGPYGTPVVLVTAERCEVSP